ncbi:hypothetical protein ACF1AE_20615 [Streptomyces sp. NPDC014986]|uniref:hypothetical protein n=1 Tax=Streptomyces sp. NPDC014986 TaxID=3364934 RepID=UPI0036FA8434
MPTGARPGGTGSRNHPRTPALPSSTSGPLRRSPTCGADGTDVGPGDGAGVGVAGDFFPGAVRDARAFDRALTGARAKQLG